VKYEYIETDAALRDYCAELCSAAYIGFDTEFVSEDRYRPDLCLLQVAADGQYAVIDPLPLGSLDPFWQVLARPGHATIVHSGREEYLFCQRAIQQRPSGWFDTQIAAGLIGLEYPASYSRLISRLLDQSLPKGETRTNWRRRPLSKRQLQYAVRDVTFLKPLYDQLAERLDQLGRTDWLQSELEAWFQRLEREDSGSGWRRVAGQSKLSRRHLAILRALWTWREAESQRRNSPPRRVLRDDLMVELARRETADLQQIRAIRGMDWRRLQRHLPAISEVISEALALPDDQCPRRPQRLTRPPLSLVGQFLAAAVASMARSEQLAPALVGSVEDVRDLIAYHLGYPLSEVPLLATGWRSQIIGHRIEQLLDGQLAIRIADPTTEQPLAFEPVADPGS
jgi:ribonuclease D